jgi:hypothetical protein
MKARFRFSRFRDPNRDPTNELECDSNVLFELGN